MAFQIRSYDDDRITCKIRGIQEIMVYHLVCRFGTQKSVIPINKHHILTITTSHLVLLPLLRLIHSEMFNTITWFVFNYYIILWFNEGIELRGLPIKDSYFRIVVSSMTLNCNCSCMESCGLWNMIWLLAFLPQYGPTMEKLIFNNWNMSNLFLPKTAFTD